MAACRVIWVSKEVSYCLHNRLCLCSVFWLSSNFFLDEGLTLYDPLSHVVNSCPMGSLKPQRLRPLVTEVAATKGSLGDRDLEKKNLASTTMLWPFHCWSAWLLLRFIGLNVFQRGKIGKVAATAWRLFLSVIALFGMGAKKVKRNRWEATAESMRCVKEVSGKILWSLGERTDLKGKKKEPSKKK